MDEIKLIPIKVERTTLSVLISGLYCGFHKVDPMAIPESLWMEIVEKLDYFLDGWEFEKCTLEQFLMDGLTIYPTDMLSDEVIDEMKKTTLYWERLNGNALLSVSMDIRMINYEGDDV